MKMDIDTRLAALERMTVRHRSVLESQDLIIIKILSLSARHPAVRTDLLALMDEMTAGLKRSERKSSATSEYLQGLQDLGLDEGLAQIAMYRKAISEAGEQR